jgi:endonuclease/exonuclease/phosphatase family metal-dependent hydrolase
VGRVAPTHAVRVDTLNLAAGRGASGVPLSVADLAAAVTELDADVLALQEVDAGQPRSHRADQAAVVAEAVGAVDWRAAATLAGTPAPVRTWRPLAPPLLRGPGPAPAEPYFGIALLSRLPVRRWSALGLGTGRACLPIRAPDPRTGRPRLWWIPDEPRAAVAAELDGLTVVATHLSFFPPTAIRQLRRLRTWLAELPGPIVVAGDLNLPGRLPGRLLGARPAVRTPTYPAARPRVQLDHLLLRGLQARDAGARALAVGDHLLLTATVESADVGQAGTT